MYLYVKIFENGKMYVGITNNFDRRMYEHQHDSYIQNSQLPIHRAMRKYSHRTEIWAQGIDDWDLLCELEKQTIAQLKEEGIELYNCTDGGEGIIGIELKRGQEHHNSKPMEYYKNKSTERSKFKRTCKNNNWDFKHFKEIDSGEKRGSAKKYYYIYVGENNKDYGVQNNEKEYYSINPTRRADFKRACNKHNWNFDEFEEINSGEKTQRVYKYYYIPIRKD